MTSRRGLWAIAAMAVLLGGCGSDPAPMGRLALGGEPGESCVPTQTHRSMLVGDVVTADSAPVTIDSVTLRNPNGVRVVDSFLLPINDGGVIGTSSYPPDDTEGWRGRVRASGAELEADTRYNLVVQVEPTRGSSGSADAIAVSYTSGDRHGEASGSTRYRFASQCF